LYKSGTWTIADKKNAGTPRQISRTDDFHNDENVASTVSASEQRKSLHLSYKFFGKYDGNNPNLTYFKCA
jgi:hypothetical protein